MRFSFFWGRDSNGVKIRENITMVADACTAHAFLVYETNKILYLPSALKGEKRYDIRHLPKKIKTNEITFFDTDF